MDDALEELIEPGQPDPATDNEIERILREARNYEMIGTALAEVVKRLSDIATELLDLADEMQGDGTAPDSVDGEQGEDPPSV